MRYSDCGIGKEVYMTKRRTEMIRNFQKGRLMATVLMLIMLLGTFGGISASAQRRYRRHHHSRAKGALIGGAIGLGAGALVGGRKGALIGAGAGAGTGYLIQRHRNRRHRRHY